MAVNMNTVKLLKYALIDRECESETREPFVIDNKYIQVNFFLVLSHVQLRCVVDIACSQACLYCRSTASRLGRRYTHG